MHCCDELDARLVPLLLLLLESQALLIPTEFSILMIIEALLVLLH